jgi:hypothetical protein
MTDQPIQLKDNTENMSEDTKNDAPAQQEEQQEQAQDAQKSEGTLRSHTSPLYFTSSQSQQTLTFD